MQKTSQPSSLEHKNAGEKLSNLSEVALTEIGRTVVHSGLLVWRVRELVAFVTSHGNTYSLSISSKEAIRIFPTILDAIKPAFTSTERYKLEKALNRIMTSREFLGRLSYCSWGKRTENRDGSDCLVRYEYRRYKGQGIRIDCQYFSVAEIRELAMEAIEAVHFVEDIQSMLERKIAEDSDCLKKLLNHER